MFGNLPFLGNELTSDSGSQAPPGGGPRTQPAQPEPKPESDPMAELQRLMAMLEQPQPKPLTRTQDIGAGLMRIGNALQGGAPNIQSGAEQAYRQASEQAIQTNTETRRGLIGDEIRRREQERRDAAAEAKQAAQNEAMLARQDAQQKAMEARQKALDDQNERQANHADAMKQLGDMIQQPGFEIPPGEDLGGLTRERMMAIAAGYFKGRIGQDNGGALAALGALVHSGGRISSVTAQVPGGSMTATGPQENRTIETSPLSPTTARQIADLGGQVDPGMTEIEGINRKGELDRKKLEQEAKDRQLRLNKTGMGRGGNSVMKEIVALNKMRRSAQAAIDMQEDSGRTLGGQYGQGMVGSKGMLALSDSISGSDFLAKRTAYESLLSLSVRGELFGDAGKNLTERELSVMAASAPPDLITKREDIQVNMLKQLRDNALQGIMDRKKLYGLSDSDVDGLLYGDAIESPLLPGMKLDPIKVNEAIGLQKAH